ncbi:hypothetical protein Efla_000273 [Eimeria flavescens]
MFQNILRSLSGSLAEFTKWEPTADRSEVSLRSGLEKSLLFLLCSSAIVGLSALTLVCILTERLSHTTRKIPILLTSAAACAAALFFETQAVRCKEERKLQTLQANYDLSSVMAKLIWSNGESSYFEFGNTAFNVAACAAGGPLVALLWVFRGYADFTSSPTCRNTAALLYGGTITNLTLTISAVLFTALMLTYYIATTKRFYDIAILACICDPVTVAVAEAAERLPQPPRIRMPEFIPLPSFEECVEKLPSYEKTRAVVKRIVDVLTPVSLPQRVNALLDIRV